MSDYYQAFFWNDINELAMVPPTIKVGSIAILWRVYPPPILKLHSRIPTEYWINGGIRGGRIAMKKLDKRTAMDAA
jgi:hypothetical protein